MRTPCDDVEHICPYADTYTGYSDEMCRVCCGLGVDEDSYPEEDDEEWEVVDPDGYAGNMHCDTYGVCGGPSCRNYYNCHA